MSKIVISRAIRYHRYGDPREVLQLEKIPIVTELQPNEVLIRCLAAPINPLDINLVEGTYAVRYSLPAVGGAEGVAEIVKLGNNVHNFKIGDRILPLHTSTWSEYAVADVDTLIPIRKDIDLISASQLSINPPTAYCMLKFFEKLDKGDCIIQNSANSGVGRAVIQLAKAFGYESINIVRNRPAIAALKAELKALGADHVFTEEEFKQNGRKVAAFVGKRLKLALNGVGGRSALAISAAVAFGGTCVTYGGMSRQPHEFSTGSLVFKNLRVCGFANGPWLQNPQNREKRAQMFKELQELIVAGKLKPTPVESHRFEDFAVGIHRHIEGKRGKQMMMISNGSSKL